MTITVIGHLSIDELHTETSPSAPDGVSERFGGIFSALVTLASLAGPDDVIHPVFGVGEKEYELVRKKLEEFPVVDSSGIYRFKGSTNRVLYFNGNNGSGRIECSKDIAQPIPFAKIKPYLDTDGLLINMVSGFDITLETLDAIRMAIRDARTPIHFDFHSLTLGIDQESKRFRRPMTDWRRWCFMLNSIQLTEEEALGLTPERYDEATLVNQLMPLMVNALVITRDDRGATAILQTNKKLTRADFPAASASPVVDSRGCGDVFGAAFLFRYCQKKNYREAAEFANQAAALKATVSGIDGLSELLGTIRTGAPAA